MRSRRGPIAIAGAWAVTLAVSAVWLAQPMLELREQLRTWQFWSLEFGFLCGLAVAAWVLRDLTRVLTRDDIIRIGVLAAVAVALTVFLAPRTNRIYYDEHIYQSIAQNLTDLRLAQICNNGTVEYGRLQCWAGEYNKQPYAYPHLLSIAYRVLGVHSSIAFGLNALVMALTVCAVYLAAFFLFSDRSAAFFAGVLIMLTPQQILWAATAAVEPSASLACVVALGAAAYFCDSRSTAALFGAGLASAYAAQFRPESILILPVVGLLLWLRARDELSRPRLWWVGLFVVVLLALHIGHLFAVRNEGWGTTDERLSLRYVAENLRVNGPFYLGDERFPVAFSLLAIVGLVGRAWIAERVTVLVYFLLLFGIDLLFYAGSYNYGADVRYSLMTYPPIAILGGLGASRIVKWLGRGRTALPMPATVTSALALQFLWYAPQVRATTEEAWAARADVRFAESMAPVLPGNSYVLTHNPGMFHVLGVNAGQMSLVFNNPTYLDYLATRYAGGVYLHWNFWCNVQVPVQQEFCRKTRELKPVVTVGEFRVRDQRFALYRFQLPNREE